MNVVADPAPASTIPRDAVVSQFGPPPQRAVSLGRILTEMFERTSCGAAIIDARGECADLNATARRLLTNGFGQNEAQVKPADLGCSIRVLLRPTKLAEAISAEREAWVMVPRPDKRELVLHTVPLGSSPDGGRTLLIMIDLDDCPMPSARALAKLFGLTPAEATVAIQIAQGRSPAEIARATRLSIATVRSQLAAVFGKTQTSRQKELVALLARVAVLP